MSENAEKRVGDIMTREVTTVFPEENLTELMATMQDCGFRHLPVVDDGKLVGLVTERDLLWLSVSPFEPGADTRSASFAEQNFVSRVMITDVVTVKADTPAREAVGLMVRNKIGALPVVDEAGGVVGIVTTSDILRLAESLL